MRRSLPGLCLIPALLLLTGCTGTAGPGRLTPALQATSPVSPASQDQVPQTPALQVKPVAAPVRPSEGFTTLPTSGGFPEVTTTVTAVSAEQTDGGIQMIVRFSQGIPVWAMHFSGHGQTLWLELSAPAAGEQNQSNQVGGYGYQIDSSTTASWITLNGRGSSEYRTAVRDNSLMVEVRPAVSAPSASDDGMKGLADAQEMVSCFLAAEVKGAQPADLEKYLTVTAQDQNARLTPFRATEYSVVRQSGQAPDTLLYAVRLSNKDAFTDQFLFVTPASSGPHISMILSHQPVTRPADPDGSSALAIALVYLDAWAKRDSKGMYAALAPSAQQSLTDEQKVLLGGLSNPHPFRYEIHAIEQVRPGCYRLQVLRAMEYTGEGELSRGIGPLYVTQADGRYGVLLQGACGN